MGDLYIKNDESCIKHEELCITNEELCTQNEELCTENDELCRLCSAWAVAKGKCWLKNLAWSIQVTIHNRFRLYGQVGHGEDDACAVRPGAYILQLIGQNRPIFRSILEIFLTD